MSEEGTEQSLREMLTRLGASFETDLRENVIGLKFSGAKFSDDEIVELSRFKKLQNLSLNNLEKLRKSSTQY